MSFLHPRYGVETQTERSEVDEKTQARSTGATWVAGTGWVAARMRSQSRSGDVPQSPHPDPHYYSRCHPNRAAEANRDTLAVNLSRCAQRPASLMADTAVGAPFQLGISGLNGREFLPKGHLLRLMIALSVL